MLFRKQFQTLVVVLVFVFSLTWFQVPQKVLNQPLWLDFKLGSTQKLAGFAQSLKLIDQFWQSQQDQVWLKQAYLESQARLSQLDRFKKENQSLRQLLEIKDQSESLGLLTTPIYSSGQALVAVGSSEGVKPGSLVFINQVLVGVVDQAWSHTARVKLFDKDPNLSLLVKTQSGVSGLMQQKKGQLELTEIPANLQVKLHEPVYTSGQPGIPAGLLVGLVSSKPPETSQSTYTVKIDPGVSFYQQSVVRIKP